MDDFISVNEALPALNMLCDVKYKDIGSINKARLIANNHTHFYQWMGSESWHRSENGAIAIIPVEYVTCWRYNENVSENEVKEWFNSLPDSYEEQ